MFYIFLADGFEELETVAPFDMLCRAGVEVKTVGVSGKTVKSAHGLVVTADYDISEITTANLCGIMLPGGAGGTELLAKNGTVAEYIDYSLANNLLVSAICAAPSILGERGYLKGKNATAYPTFQHKLQGAILSPQPVVVDGNIITAIGAGVSIEFGLEIVKYLVNEETANQIKEAIQC